MNWQEIITRIYTTQPYPAGMAARPAFHSAYLPDEIADGEARLHARFPLSLRSLLLESNGVMTMIAMDGGEWSDDMWLLWTLADIVNWNLFYRAETEKGTYERDFHNLLFFANAGCDGIEFGFPVMPDGVCSPMS